MFFRINGQPHVQHPIFRLFQQQQQQIVQQQKQDLEYYEVLKVSVDATQEEIRSSYKRESLKHHPDKGGSQEIFVKLQHAYSVLSDELERKCYDCLGKSYAQHPHLEMIKQQFKSQDLNLNLEIDLPDLLKGTKKTIEYQRFKNGVHEKVSLDIFIEKNTPNNHEIIFNNQGHCEPGKVTGNVIVTLKEKPFPDWRRSQNMLFHTKTINLNEMLTGRLEIKKPDECIIKMNIINMQPNEWYKHPDEDLYINYSVRLPTSGMATKPIDNQEIRDLLGTVQDQGEVHRQCPIQ